MNKPKIIRVAAQVGDRFDEFCTATFGFGRLGTEATAALAHWLTMTRRARGQARKRGDWRRVMGRPQMRIKCAAIRYGFCVHEGASHAEIGIRMVLDGVCKRPVPSGDNQGFVTECGVFVRRAAAMSIAICAGQVERGKTLDGHELYSEDLSTGGKEQQGGG